jgi:hypothetical protein
MKRLKHRILLVVMVLMATNLAIAQENRSLLFTTALNRDMNAVRWSKEFKGGDPIFGVLRINKTENSNLENVKGFSTLNDDGTRVMTCEIKYGPVDDSFEGSFTWSINVNEQRLANDFFAFTIIPNTTAMTSNKMPYLLLHALQGKNGKKVRIYVAIQGKGNEQDFSVSDIFVLDLTGGMGAYEEMWKPYGELEAKQQADASTQQQQQNQSDAAKAEKAKQDEIAAEAKVALPVDKWNEPKLNAEIKTLMQDHLGKDYAVYKIIIPNNDFYYKKNDLGILMSRTLEFWVGYKNPSGDCLLSNKFYIIAEHITGGQFSKNRVEAIQSTSRRGWYQPCTKLTAGK